MIKDNESSARESCVVGQWDFRDDKELELDSLFKELGYTITHANPLFLEKIKSKLEDRLHVFSRSKNIDLTNISLGKIHKVFDKSISNDLRLFILQELSCNTTMNKLYYNSSKDIVHRLCGNELAMQKRISLSINFPNNVNDILPIHADTWNGVSPYELNIWIPLVDCRNSMCLYILERDKYEKYKLDSPSLLKLDSDALFKELEADLKWIEIRYGDILAFDQSLPHGYSLNAEDLTHWSLNCRFKGLHTPYWDKKLGEYFMPITLKTCSSIGLEYEYPMQWVVD